MIILLDVDGVLGNFTAGARDWLYERHGRRFKDEQIVDYNIMTSFGMPDGWPGFIEWLSDVRFCRDMPVYEGSVDFVGELRKLGEVIAVTSPFVGVDHWESDRRRWLEQHFAIGHDDLVFCKRKELVRGHVLIDDSIKNCEAFARKSSYRDAILFDRPWNRESSLQRAKSYGDVLKLLEAKS